MTDEPDNLILQHLRAIRQDVSLIRDDMQDMRLRLSAVESAIVRMQHSMDRFDIRLSTIERRLGLIEAP